MEVDAESFPSHLLGLLINISEADFVSLDLELSGIPSRLPDKPARGPGRLTLEERYAETKMAADRYQILQVGITCARFDYIENNYVLRPYNINISPLLSERMDFEREITFQSGACSFLLEHNFDLGAPFARGVQYLSREEADRAKTLAWARIEKKNPIQDLQVKDDDVETLDFFRRAREAIAEWKKDGKTPSLDITTHTGFPKQPLKSAITNFEKRLVHQLVRHEFPDLVSIGQKECIRIIYWDPDREADNMRRIKSRVKEQIIRQTGFRWVFEALVHGGDVDPADPFYFMRINGGMPISADSHGFKERYDRAVERLKTKKPVLVGHNMFTDIVYLYRTFVGQLPDTLQGFNEAIHELFPKIIDTKYLATHAEGDLNASPTLEQIAKGLNSQLLPKITTHVDHSQYGEAEAFHEAGYDSLLTATILLRLAAKVGVEQQMLQVVSQLEKNGLAPRNETSRDGEGTECSAPQENERIEDTTFPPDTVNNAPNGEVEIDEATTQSPKDPEVASFQTKSTSKARKRAKNKKKKDKTDEAAHGRFHTRNVFDALQEAVNKLETDAKDVPPCEWDKDQEEEAGSWENQEFVQDKTGWVPIEKVQRQAMELIPAFDSDFWKEFGNTLRVFGTEEAVLKIADW